MNLEIFKLPQGEGRPQGKAEGSNRVSKEAL